ncbi:RidA family protein [Pollutimonas bauzanensis]|uniref:Enamine deaminase RidA, house cleaning of reactive enamine intermediates, YjgF/YER057c/UK114 family n=1 Tax=Pollutimonas bauzanensis TaxID=658167 RepID=A0A1M6A613_9BURK|nr:RidA family protein [Pollutimonas bauzanensis]SHI31835.1 Enamine deaminase RidA, house cleaning of reactive enamine intermediates, YjgF/YER057c/UK114 family [Pollutimonas bauzanensis]
MELINNAGKPPAGHYSPAVSSNGLIFLSGILPARPGAVDFADEVGQALNSCKEVLAQAQCTLDDVVQCTAYIVGVENWPEFNRVYMEAFGRHKPARTVVPVPQLHHGCLVELQLVAARRP